MTVLAPILSPRVRTLFKGTPDDGLAEKNVAKGPHVFRRRHAPVTPGAAGGAAGRAARA